MSELKPCPFCGGSAHVAEIAGGREVVAYTVCCDAIGECIASDPMRYYQTEAEAIEAWNTRAERTCSIYEVPSGVGWTEFQCSECGCNRIDKHDSYCPNCGAKVVEG